MFLLILLLIFPIVSALFRIRSNRLIPAFIFFLMRKLFVFFWGGENNLLVNERTRVANILSCGILEFDLALVGVPVSLDVLSA